MKSEDEDIDIPENAKIAKPVTAQDTEDEVEEEHKEETPAKDKDEL